MTARRASLPPMAERYLRTQQVGNVEKVVRRFHEWLANKHIAVSGLRAEELDSFFEVPFRRIVTPRTAQLYRRGIISYLAWLHDAGTLGFDPKQLGIRRRRPLPRIAVEFLDSLRPTLRESTCRGYQTSLQRFHEWLDDGRVRIRLLTRRHLEQWLLALSDEGLHPSTRIHLIENVRTYLRWLFERGELRHHPDALILSRDHPKLPQYLPRPLPPEVDRELQTRLGRSPSPRWQGLLLMRHTGLRIGELRTLAYDCVREDSNGRGYLKVPLGKLNTERLVPLAASTSAIIRGIQTTGDPKRALLIESIKGGPVGYAEMRETLQRASEGLQLPEPITSHRLRHTYATSLLDAGMSLVAVMKLLGHRDYRMTLRYTAISQESVLDEYRAALVRMEERYADLKARTASSTEHDPLKTLVDLTAWTKNRIGQELGHTQLANTLAKRIGRLADALTPFVANARPGKVTG